MTSTKDEVCSERRAGIVLFVCTSNTCRSPMAEAVAKKWFSTRLGVPEGRLATESGWDIRSGGLTADYEPHGSPASANGVTAMKRYGLDITQHRSNVLSPQELDAASYIFCVTSRHVEWISQVAPSAAKRAKTLGGDIPDPWHQEQKVYDACAEHMVAAVPRLMEAEFGGFIPPSGA